MRFSTEIWAKESTKVRTYPSCRAQGVWVEQKVVQATCLLGQCLAIFREPLSLSSSSLCLLFHCFLLLQGGSEKRLLFSIRSPRRNARWMRTRGRTGLPITWVSAEKLASHAFPGALGGAWGGRTQRGPLDSVRTRNPAAQPVPGFPQEPIFPGGHRA